MGTNYYVEDDPTCNNPEHTETLHVGKSSAGWIFGFQAYPEKGLISWAAWQAFLTNKEIKDEYERSITFDEFRHLVESKQRSEGRDPGKKNISRMDLAVRRNPDIWGPHYIEPDPDREWSDPEGYDFYSGEFS